MRHKSYDKLFRVLRALAQEQEIAKPRGLATHGIAWTLRTCNGREKRAYQSEAAAKAGANIAQNQELRAYRCAICQGWHLTKKLTP